VPAPRVAWRRYVALRGALREQLRGESPPAAIHFHGVLSWLCGWGLAGPGSVVRVWPHGSALARWAGPWWHGRRADLRPVASSGFDLALLRQVGHDPPLIEGVVSRRFLRAVRRESPRALLLSGGAGDDAAAVARYCRLAVVFGAPELALGFAWCGPLSARCAAQLKAAGIRHIEAPDDALAAMRSAWAYVDASHETGFPIRLAQAMACGVPCLAADVPAHRGVIDDGRTGLLFRSEAEATQMVGALIDDARLRRRLGDAARRAARRRFDEGRLRSKLAALCGLDGSETAQQS
jgi:glycosyltransferase involved in cell wall biosynthesis